MNTIKVIKESFSSYRENIKNLFLISIPVIFLTIVVNYFSEIINENVFSDFYYISLFSLCLILNFLYATPALYLNIQKKEDGQDFDISQAYAFQNKNIFRWIKLIFWTYLYTIKVLLPYIIVSLLFFVLSAITSINIIFIILTFLPLVVGSFINLPKFIFYINIFFSKSEISARDSVRESIELGKNNKKQIWFTVLNLIIINIVLMSIYLLIKFILSVFYGLVDISFLSQYIDIVLYGLIYGLIIIPLNFIILAKSYSKIKN